MKKIRKLAAGLALLGFAVSANAVQIDGAIGFGSETAGGNTTWAFIGACNTTADCSGFDLTPDSNNASVSFASGDLAGLLGLTATLADVNVTLLPVSPTWTVGGFTFVLQTAVIEAVVNTGTFKLLSITGTGLISDPGFETTAGVWDWTGSATGTASNIAFSFNSNTASVPTVPAPGSLGLLALGLLGVGGAARRRKV